jgi:GDP-L-fucose synthase
MPQFKTPYRLAGRRVWVAGHLGMVGSAIARRLAGEGCELLTATRRELDLTRQRDVDEWMAAHKPEALFLAAAKVGGIMANATEPAEFIHSNLSIQTNVIHAAWKTGVEKLLFLGSACIYPKEAAQPIAEDALLSGPLEPTNRWYAVAKIAGIEMCDGYRRQYGCDFISAQPTNVYGPGDNFDPASGHVMGALMTRAHRAKLERAPKLVVWGTGRPLREFLFVDDLADALVFLMENYSDDGHVNVGSGVEISIADLARLICRTVGYEGELVFDAGKPDGVARRVLDCRRLRALGWTPKTPFEDGLKRMYADYLGRAGAA